MDFSLTKWNWGEQDSIFLKHTGKELDCWIPGKKWLKRLSLNNTSRRVEFLQDPWLSHSNVPEIQVSQSCLISVSWITSRCSGQWTQIILFYHHNNLIKDRTCLKDRSYSLCQPVFYMGIFNSYSHPISSSNLGVLYCLISFLRWDWYIRYFPLLLSSLLNFLHGIVHVWVATTLLFYILFPFLHLHLYWWSVAQKGRNPSVIVCIISPRLF